MEIIRLYACLCDLTRLRILHLLLEGPLCVCHLQEALREPQAKVSKHLAYLKRSGMVEVRRCGHWRIYGLPARRSAQLQANLACLQDCAREEPVFRRDAARLRAVRSRLGADCPVSVCSPRHRRHAAVTARAVASRFRAITSWSSGSRTGFGR